MEYYKNIKIEQVGDKWELTIKVSDMFSQKLILSSDQLEHIINSYRKIK